MNFSFYAVFYIAGAYCIFLGLKPIVLSLLCTQAVKGFYLETITKHSYRGRSVREAKFFYDYDGTEYRAKTYIGIPNKMWSAFRTGQEHTLYVNPKRPQMFVFSRKLSLLNNILPIIIGVALLFSKFWLLDSLDLFFTVTSWLKNLQFN